MAESTDAESPTGDGQAASRGFYLRSLRLKNFRSCYDAEIPLQPNLTLLVGENNSGKSNVIEALRLATTAPNNRRTRYFESADLARRCGSTTIDLCTEFADATSTQRGLYIPALDLGTKAIIYGVRFTPTERRRRRRPEFYAGPSAGADAEPEAREQIRHVYLEPLRDAQRALASTDGSRLAAIMELLFDEEKRADFVKVANVALERVGQHGVVTDTSGAIQEHIDALTKPVRGQSISIGLVEQELRRLTRSFRIKMAEHGFDPADLSESGLGYANLLFIATVILELQFARDAELTIFLVEEPEAHLHPQLQVVLLDYLRDQAETSGADDAHAPAGRIQVVATTHSPNLASSVPINNVVVLRSIRQPEPGRADLAPDGEEASAARGEEPVGDGVSATRAIAIAELGLGASDARKISQYLDATKVALLFARRVILVEGIAEAVLLPVLANRCVLAGVDCSEGRRAFRAVTTIPVGSVDFEPYVRLLLSSIAGTSIITKLVVVTDLDPPVGGADDDAAVSETVVRNRRQWLEEVAAECGAESRLKVFESEFTLEADLLTKAVNLGVVETAFLKQRPRSHVTWNSIAANGSPAEAFYRRLKANRRFISKGEFAHDIAASIADGASFECPDYLAAAIKETLRDVSP